MQYPKLVESKTAANEIVTVEWNPGMDLLATVFSNGALTCSRLLSLQRVWHRQPNGEIISISWRPDGRILAVGAYNEKTKENVCALHDVEDGKEIFTIRKDKPITSVSWYQYTPIDDNKNRVDPMEPKKPQEPREKVVESFSHQLAHQQTKLNILMISTDDGKISFYSLGLFYLGDIDLHNNSSPCSKAKITQTHMSTCMRYLTAIMFSSPLGSNLASLKVIKLNTFQGRSGEILRVSKMYAKIIDELEYFEDTINAITTSWTDVLAGLDNKLSSYCSRKNRNSDESRSGYTFLSADELLQLLVLGFPSDNLEKFLTDMSDKGLKKLNHAIEQTCLRVQNLIVKNAEKCCYHLHGDLNMLKGMALWEERYSDIGLDVHSIIEAMRSVGSLTLKLTELQQVIDHSLRSTKSFFRWLISIAYRITGEQNNSAIPNDINKTTQQDIQLITDFILENFDYNSNQDELGSLLGQEILDSESSVNYSNRPTCSNFTLEQVGQYLKNEPLSRLKHSFAKPGSNFWIDFFKNHLQHYESMLDPENKSSALLFYPHNADTSLIQEHKDTCKAINEAFESVPANIKLSSEGGSNFLNLNEFLRNALVDRVRVETDVLRMRHYTLFLLKPKPTVKQYLICQSLNDRSFKLISIEFRPIVTGPSKTARPPLSIRDSDFYENKETKEMLLTFLVFDESTTSTMIIQMELSKIVSDHCLLGRNQRDIPKIFRSNDSIEKYSSQIEVKLDLFKEPPHERKHEPEVMMKKIGGVSGSSLFCSSGRGVLAFTSFSNKRLHLYEMESPSDGSDITDDKVETDEKIDESFIDTDLI